MKKIAGFIVLLGGEPAALFPPAAGTDEPKNGMLWLGGIEFAVTLFPDRKTAKKVIDRTIAYTESHNFAWGSGYNIVPVKAYREKTERSLS